VALASKLKIENLGSLATVAFYGIAGIAFLILLPLSGFPPHVGLAGITSLIAAYGLLKKRSWAIWLVVALFFVATTFALVTLYYALATDAVTSAAMLAYVLLTWIFTAYAISKRKAET
jgi:ABC-type glycerol-3-phosphate transport system permease component